MKIAREKRIRKEFVKGKIDQVLTQIMKSIGRKEEVGKKSPQKSPQNICTETGRTRAVISSEKISRHMYRKHAENGNLEGVRRGT